MALPRTFLHCRETQVDAEESRYQQSALRSAAMRFDSHQENPALAALAWLPRKVFALKQALGWGR